MQTLAAASRDRNCVSRYLPWTAAAMLVCLTATSASAEDGYRTWQDASGNFKVTAKLIGVEAEVVTLETKDGRQLKVPVGKLSEADQRLLNAPATGAGAPVIREQMLLTAVLGVELSARDGPCSNVQCSFPLPQSWPEQRVTVVKREQTPNVRRLTVIEQSGVNMARFTVGRMKQGESAKAVFHLRVQRSRIAPPRDVDVLQIPQKLEAALGKFLGESPFIEVRHPKVKAAAGEVVLDASQPAWTQVRSIYDFTRSKVKYSGVRELKGALRGIESGSGDCEERTSVFVAICRLKGIPARSVWIPGHTYPEFYLEDGRGNGWWFPCESVADRFGMCGNSFLIMQKGDRFRVPGHRKPQRYVTETLTGKVGPGSVPPLMQPVREVKLVLEKQ